MPTIQWRKQQAWCAKRIGFRMTGRRSETCIEDVHARRAERQAELGLQHLGDAGAHEIDDGLRRVDDAVRVSHL